MGNQFSPPLTVSHGREHPCYQHYQWQQELAQRQIARLQQRYRHQRELTQQRIASLQQYYRQQREAKRRGAGTGYERRGSTPDSTWPLPGGKLIFP
jgi:hypothetical protein